MRGGSVVKQHNLFRKMLYSTNETMKLHVSASNGHHQVSTPINPLNAELNPICHLLALLGGTTIVVVSRLRVKKILYICVREC